MEMKKMMMMMIIIIIIIQCPSPRHIILTDLKVLIFEKFSSYVQFRLLSTYPCRVRGQMLARNRLLLAMLTNRRDNSPE
jgi:hypothetical protein